MKKIILASASPRRLEIFRENGIEPIVIPAKTKENQPLFERPCDTVGFLALKKALAVSQDIWTSETYDSALVVGADTIVFDKKIIGKPETASDAMNTLLSLSGRQHLVYTGVAMIDLNTHKKRCFCGMSKVYFCKFTKEEIEDYIKSEEPYDKAGGYAIQGTFKKYIEKYEGDLNNIIGFPWDRFCREIDLWKI